MSAHLKCPRCASPAIRRSMPRTAVERLVRALTPYHYFLCRDCEYRGTYLGVVPAGEASEPFRFPRRPVESRDRDAARRRLVRTLTSVAIAGFLGLAAGIYLHGCRNTSEMDARAAAEAAVTASVP